MYKFIILISLIFQINITYSKSEGNPEIKTELVKFKAARLLINDPMDNRPLQAAKNAFLESVRNERWSKEIEDSGEVPQEPMHNLLTKGRKIELKEEGGEKNLVRDPAYALVPKNYTPTKSYPLIISLHGYSSFQFVQGIFLPFQRWVSDKGYILVIPSGHKDKKGKQFWNATEFCCNFDLKNIDDEAYLRKLIFFMKKNYNVSKVIIVGHSNGGFMAHRLACSASDIIDGIITWGSSTFYNPQDCNPKNPVNILDLHGTADGTIPFNGIMNVLPSAPSVNKQWASMMNCQNKEHLIHGFSLNVKGPSFSGKQIDFTGFKNCNGGKNAIFGVIPGGRHVFPRIDTKLWEYIIDLAIFNNYNIESTKINEFKLIKTSLEE